MKKLFYIVLLCFVACNSSSDSNDTPDVSRNGATFSITSETTYSDATMVDTVFFFLPDAGLSEPGTSIPDFSETNYFLIRGSTEFEEFLRTIYPWYYDDPDATTFSPEDDFNFSTGVSLDFLNNHYLMIYGSGSSSCGRQIDVQTFSSENGMTELSIGSNNSDTDNICTADDRDYFKVVELNLN